MAVCSVCGTGWCGCGGGRVCGDCKAKGAVKRLRDPSPGPTTARPVEKPTAPAQPKTFVTTLGASRRRG